MNLGNAIKEIRKERKISQTQLATACGVTQTTISQIESNVKHPHYSNLKKICKALAVPEILLHIISAEEKDIPKSKKELFNTLFPVIKKMSYQLYLTE